MVVIRVVHVSGAGTEFGLRLTANFLLERKLATTERTEDTEKERLTGMNLRVLRALRGGEVISQCTLRIERHQW